MQGIYKIVNNKNDKVYIGSSKNIENRFKQHMAKLKNNDHHSIKLQRFYNKYKDYKVKKLILNYEVIELVEDNKQLKEREQYHIDNYDSYYSGYNCTSKVDNPQYSHKNINKRLKKQEIKKAKEDYFLLKNSLEHMYYTYNSRQIDYDSTGFTDLKISLVNELLKYFIWNYDIEKYSIIIHQYNNVVYLEIYSSNHLLMERYKITKSKVIVLDEESTNYYKQKNNDNYQLNYDKDITNLYTDELLELTIDHILKYPELYAYEIIELKNKKKYKFRKREIFPILEIPNKKFSSYSHIFVDKGFIYTDSRDIFLYA